MDLHTLVTKYKQLADQLNKDPTYYELIDYGVTEYAIKKHGGIRRLRKLVGSEKDFSDSDEPPPIPNAEPKVLVLDLELTPIEAYVWGLRDQNIGLNQIKKDWFIMSFAAKWLGAPENEIIYHDIRHTPENDEALLGYLWQLFDEADFILTQNGKRFDTKKANARFVMSGFYPPSSYRQIDTLTIARSRFGFTSNKLEFMTDKLCVKYKKLKHEKFVGMSLWTECLNSNMEAWQEMEKYNKHDILSTEELYLKLRAWKPEFNFNAFSNTTQNKCICGSTDFREGVKYTNNAAHARFNCNDCGAEYVDKSRNLLSGLKKASLKELSI